MKAIRPTLIYAALLAGAVVFGWPFLWMLATSAKLERELFSQRAGLLPEAPPARLQSPYLDDRVFADLAGPRLPETLQLIVAQLESTPLPSPNDIDPAKLRQQLARGIYQHLVATLPPDTWAASSDVLRQTIAKNVSQSLLADLTARLCRVFCLGQLRASSYDLQEDQLIAPENAATAWLVSGDAVLRQVEEASEPHAEMHYDFRQSNVVTLTQTFRTSFPVARLHRIQFYLRNDNNWHAITLAVEKNGSRFEAERAVDDADFNWAVDSWQEAGPDDRPEKIRTWTLLHRTATGPQFINSPNDLKVTLELHRRTLLQACWAKALHNYRLTLDYIPFWRYVANSVYLVILNLVGSLFSCSLVAYAFARLTWPGRSIAFALLLGTMMIPSQVTMIPQFLIFQKLGWYNTLRPLWVTSFFATAFNVFLLTQFMKGIPRELEDAARLDGCGFLRIYWHIILPLIRPALATVAIFTFLAIWNDFLLPLIYVSDQRLYPLSFGMYAFQIQAVMPGTSAGVGMLMAGALLMMLPVLAMFFFAQRYFLQGITWSGLKA